MIIFYAECPGQMAESNIEGATHMKPTKAVFNSVQSSPGNITMGESSSHGGSANIELVNTNDPVSNPLLTQFPQINADTLGMGKRSRNRRSMQV